ncbi:MAG: pyridoxal phosphate-dependent aminotransferase [Planctomycetota bacterium]|jgi:aspartate aminotransferase/aminotransferase
MPDPIDLSIGQADFDVPDEIKKAAIEAIGEGFNRYTVTQGIPELRERILASLKERYAYTPDECLVTCGVSGGLVLSMLCLINPGDEVLLPDPYFVMYKVLVDLCQGVPKYYNLYPDFKIRREELEKQITEKTKLIVLNTPANPTGAVLSPAELSTVADLAKAHDIHVVCDEIYERFIYLDRFHSISEYYQDKLILLGGFSKTYGMPGWRMGYAVGPKELMDKMMVLQQFTFVCAPSFAQKAVLTALDMDVTEYIEKYRVKRDMVFNGLKDHYKTTRPDGSFYIFPQLPKGVKGQDFVKKALSKKVLVVPGSAFSRQDTHFRISFAAPDEDLKKGVDILRSFAQEGNCSSACGG